jgi:hypothetical protein
MRSILKKMWEPKSKPVPAEIHDEMIRALQRKIKAQHAALYLIAKSQGGSVIIPKWYVVEYGNKIGSVVFSDSMITGGMRIESRDAEECVERFPHAAAKD